MITRRALLLLGIITAGCGGGSGGIGCSVGGPAAGTPPAAKMRFAIIPKALDIPVFNYAKLGAERAAAEFGDVEVLWSAPASADQLKQKEILESVHHATRRRHRHLGAQRGLSDRDHQSGH